MTIKAHFDGKVLVPDEPLALREGQEVELTIQALSKEEKKGMTGRELVEYIHAHPELTQMWEEIAAGRDSVEVAQELRRRAWSREPRE
jgi:hypothetical protein